MKKFKLPKTQHRNAMITLLAVFSEDAQEQKFATNAKGQSSLNPFFDNDVLEIASV